MCQSTGCKAVIYFRFASVIVKSFRLALTPLAAYSKTEGHCLAYFMHIQRDSVTINLIVEEHGFVLRICDIFFFHLHFVQTRRLYQLEIAKSIVITVPSYYHHHERSNLKLF